MTLVRERMSSPVVALPPDAPIDQVIDLLASHAISAVPIVDRGKLVGVLSTTDLLGAVAKRGSGRAEVAADWMTTPALTVAPNDALEEAARCLVEGRVHRLVVTEGERAVGILSARDVLEEIKVRRFAEPIELIMSAPVETIDVGDTIDEAVLRLARAGVHGLVVLDERDPIGVFTQTQALAARRLPPALRLRPVEEVMSYETICLSVTTPIYRAAAYCASMDVRRILVVRQRHLVGILSVVDLVKVLVAPRRAA